MSKNLEVNVKVNVTKAEQGIKRVNNSLNKMQQQINRTSSVSARLANTFGKTNVQITNGTRELRIFKGVLNQVNKSASETGNIFDGIWNKVRGIAAAYLGIMSAKGVLTASDTITSAENKLNYINGGNAAMTQSQMDKMYISSQNARTNYGDMMSNTAKSMTLAPGAFGNNMDNAIRFQEIMAKSYTLGGASQQEQHSSMYQMIQALGSGKLAGDELRSVREGAPLAYQKIEEFAKGVYGANENLKDLASEGKITSEIVVQAIMGAGDSVDSAFADTQMTFSQSFTNMKNTALKAFEPVLQRMNDFLNSEDAKKILLWIQNTIVAIANTTLIFMDILGNVFSIIKSNLPFIKALLEPMIALLMAGIITLALTLAKTIMMATIKFIMLNSAMFLVVLSITFIIMWLWNLAKTSSSVCDFIARLTYALAFIILGVLTLVMVYAIATGTLLMSIPMMIFLFVMALLLLGVMLFVKYTDVIMGVMYGVGEVFKTIWENIKLAFSNILDTMKYLFWKWVDSLINDFRPFLELINAALEVFDKKTINLDFAANKAQKYSDKIGFQDVGAAYDKGYAIGAEKGLAIQDKINNLGDSVKNKIKLPTQQGNELQTTSLGGISNNVADTADNTGKMADSMEITEKDLAYLKDLANLEWKKEYTVAQISVDMTNNNNINDSSDWEGWVGKLGEALSEELAVRANGVYSY